jgi:CRISPR/Cas system CSM-associated protein Csm3 (group 7 of RAMP superfamily)
MTSFRNAYHFVPRKPNDQNAESRTLPDHQRDFGLRLGHESEGHAIYAQDAHSGRITCRITLECPTVIGGAREQGVKNESPAKVTPFLLGDKPAIPASSLKGMLSLIAESAARAPYRVLEDMQLTVAFTKNDRELGRRFTVRHKAIDGKSEVIHSTALKSYTEKSQIRSSHAYFDDSLLPMAIKDNKIKRALVNPVESMFGFVAEADKNQQRPGRGKVNSVAGKLRLTHARPSADWAGRPVSDFYLQGNPSINPDASSSVFDRLPKGVTLTLLKEQGEPMKTPKRQDSHKKAAGFTEDDYGTLRSATPNFYFFEKDKPSDFVAKSHFATQPATSFEAQGAKFYLHNPNSIPDPETGATKEPWRTRKTSTPHEGIDRKAAAPIMRHGITFDFHIDFDNLTDHELNILCFALRPSERFRHKIGLGKALGLGSIRIDVTGLVLIDREARYTPDALFQDDPRDEIESLGLDTVRKRAETHDAWLAKADPGARTALLAIGETHDFDGKGNERNARAPVLWVPLTEEAYQSDRENAEENSYEWFTRNDASSKQKLAPITDHKIPTLKTIEKTPQGGRPKGGAYIAAQSDVPGALVGTLVHIKPDKNGKLFAHITLSEKVRYFVPPHVLRASGLTTDDVGKRVFFTLEPAEKADAKYGPKVIRLRRPTP